MVTSWSTAAAADDDDDVDDDDDNDGDDDDDDNDGDDDDADDDNDNDDDDDVDDDDDDDDNTDGDTTQWHQRCTFKLRIRFYKREKILFHILKFLKTVVTINSKDILPQTVLHFLHLFAFVSLQIFLHKILEQFLEITATS